MIYTPITKEIPILSLAQFVYPLVHGGTWGQTAANSGTKVSGSRNHLGTDLIVSPMALFVLLSASTRTGLISTNFSVFLLVFGNPEVTHLLATAFQLVNSARRDLINVNRTGANALQSVICIESEKAIMRSFSLLARRREAT